jgi:hypothetical protein
MTEQQSYTLHCGIQEYFVSDVLPRNLVDVTGISMEPAVSIFRIEE